MDTSHTAPDPLPKAAPRFRHRRRPEWGTAELIQHARGRYTPRFDDGQERSFSARFFHLLEPVGPHGEPLDDDTPSREAALAATEARRAPAAGASSPIDLPGQLAVFLELYPGGFVDPGYRSTYRTRRAGERRSRQVDPSISEAARLLGRSAFERPRAATSPEEVRKATLAVAASSSLVGPAELAKPLAALGSPQLRRFSTGLQRLLYGVNEPGDKIMRWVETLGELGISRASWPMVTLLPALVHPTELPFVKPLILQRQGAIHGLGDHLYRSPSCQGYRWFSEVVEVTRARLDERGQGPRDLFDVAFFSEITLSGEGERVRASQQSRTDPNRREDS